MSVRIGLFMFGWEERGAAYGFKSLGWISHFVPVEIGLYESTPFQEPGGCIWSKEILNGYVGDRWGFYEPERGVNE